MLIRSPMPSEVERVIEFADLSFNTEISVIRRLSDQAIKGGKIHDIVLMIDLGDLREGILPSEVDVFVKEIKTLGGVRLVGIGTNLACFGGIRPTAEKMRELSSIAADIQRQQGRALEIVSGGNSANHQWFMESEHTGLINHLRVGEAILLGCETLTRKPIPGLYTDAFTLVGRSDRTQDQALATLRRYRPGCVWPRSCV